MGLEETNVIDMITRGGDGRLNLVVVDSGMTEDEGERLSLLVEKLRSYMQYCLDNAFAERHPGVSIEQVQFLVMCATPPTRAMQGIETISAGGARSTTFPVVFG